MPITVSHNRRSAAKAERARALRALEDHARCEGLASYLDLLPPKGDPYHRALAALPEDPDPDDVTRLFKEHGKDKLYGMSDPTLMICDSCQERRPVLIQIGEVIDYGSATTDVCESCLRKAVILATQEGVFDAGPRIAKLIAELPSAKL